MSTLGKAIIMFAADTAAFRSDVGRAVHIFEGAVGRMQKLAFAFKGSLAGGLSLGSMAAFTKTAIDQADEIGKLSQKTGIQVERLSELRFAAELGNVTNEQFNVGLREWNKTLVEASNSTSKEARLLKALGVDITAGPLPALRQFADALSLVQDEELRVSIASAVMKKAGEAWIPTFLAGSRGLDVAAEKARGLGIVMSTDFAQKAEKFNDDMRTLTKSSEALGIVLAEKVVPALAGAASRLADAAAKGELWLGVIRESARLGAAGLGPSPVGIAAGLVGAGIDAMKARPPSGFQADVRRIDNALLARSAPDPKKVRDALAGGNEALLKRQIAALQQMEEKRKGLFELNEQELMQERIRAGTYRDFDDRTKTRLMQLAREIDLRAQHVKAIELGIAAAQAEIAAREHGEEIYRDFLLRGRGQLEQLRLDVDLVGASAREQERANAGRAIELELLERKRRAAQAYGEDVAGLMVEVARLDAEASRQRAEAMRLIGERQDKEREFAVGAKVGFAEYADAATDAAANARNAIVSGLQQSEEALLRWSQTGKLASRDLANAIIADMQRVLIRQQVTGPAAAFLGGLFTGGGGRGGVVAADQIAAIGLASGGIMTSRGALPLERYSGGGIANRPQVAIFGEGRMAEAFVPLPDGRRIPVAMEGGGGGIAIHQTINFAANTPAAVRDAVFALAPLLEERAVQALYMRQRRGVRA